MNTKFETVNSASLLIRSWSIEEYWARVIIVHGYGEHSGRYREIAECLNNLGCDVISYDRRGEGQSEGKHGHIENIENHVEDFRQVCDRYKNDSGKTIILAHSLGGLIIAKYLIKNSSNEIDGVFFSSPFLRSPDNVAPILKKIAPIAAKLLPWLPTVRLDTTLLSRDPAEVKKYEEDPHIFHGATNAKTGYQMLKTQYYVQKHFSKITIPFVVIHGTGDEISDPKGSQLLFDHASSTNKEIKLFPGLYHETMHSPEKHLFFDAIQEFLKKHSDQ